MNNLRDVFVADFETLTKAPTKVWLAGFCRAGNLEKDNVKIQYNINDFLNLFFNYKRNCKVYFHNLSFDGSFIIYFLEKEKFIFTTKYKPKKNKEYSYLIDELGSIFYIKININNHIITFLDSFKLYRAKLKRLAEDFNCKYKKLEIDYNHNPKKKATKNEEEYIKNDILILSELIYQYYKNFNKVKITISTQAKAEFCNTLKTNFRWGFPELTNDADSFIRSAYRGGICYISKKIKKDKVYNFKNGVVYDYNSMYPSMLHSKSGNRYPYGQPSPIWDEQDLQYRIKQNKLFIIKISCKFKLKKNKIPCISGLRGRFYENDTWESDSKGQTILTLTNIDFKLLIDNYDVSNLKFIKGYYFINDKIGIYDNFINKWYKIKESSDGAKREFAKYILNSFIGKMGQKKTFVKKIVKIKNKKLKGELYYDNGLGEYLPTPVFCNSYARAELVNTINSNYDNFLYCDTDSIHLKDNKNIKNIKIGEGLCEWKKETDFIKCKYIKLKTYIEKTKDKKYIIKCSGLTEEAKEKYNNESCFKKFKIGAIFKNSKRTLKRVEGGVIIENTDFTIKP